MARQPSSASTASRSPGSQLWQVDTGAVLPHRRLDRYPTRPAAPPDRRRRWSGGDGSSRPAAARGRGSGPQRPGTGPLASSQAVRRPWTGSSWAHAAGAPLGLHASSCEGTPASVAAAAAWSDDPGSARNTCPRRLRTVDHRDVSPLSEPSYPTRAISCASGWLVVASPTSRSLGPTGRPGRQSDAATGQVRPSAAFPAARGPTQRPGRGPVAASSAGARGRRNAAS